MFIQREIAKKIGEKCGFVGNDDSADVSLQFHIVLHKSNNYVKFQCFMSYFGQVSCLVLKSGKAPELSPHDIGRF